MDNENETEKIKSWIHQSFNTNKCKIIIEGTSDETNGFIGDIIFVKVILCDGNEELHLAVKVGKSDPEVRKQISIRKACEREIFFYDNIKKFFDNFQEEKGIDVFVAAPKCFKTFLDEDSEVLILENLKKQGFVMHNANEPLNLNHIRLGLKHLAKFHALSFAVRDQKRREFDDLTKCLEYPNRPKNAVTYLKSGTKLIQQLKKAGRNDLAITYQQFVEKGLHKILIEILDDSPEEKVVNHCDCHNNNFLFQYEDESKETPSEMKILDFQLTSLHSPVLDISFFLYMAAAKHELLHFVHLMEHYHYELSTALYQLKSNVNELFPMSQLWNHWDKYSSFGFIIATLSLEVFYINKEDAISIRTNRNKSVLENLSTLDNCNNAYSERLAAIVDHFVNFKKEL